MCFFSPPSPQLGKWTPPPLSSLGWTTYGNFEYRIFSDDKVSFSAALQGCEAEDADLTSIVTPLEQFFLQEWLFASAFVNQVWIGGTVSTDGDATLTWSDISRTDLLEPLWLDGQPSFEGPGGPCAMLQISDPIDGTIDGGWLTRRCRASRGYGMCATVTAQLQESATFFPGMSTAGPIAHNCTFFSISHLLL